MNGSGVCLGILIAALACGSSDESPPAPAADAKDAPSAPAPAPAQPEPAAAAPAAEPAAAQAGDVAAGKAQYKIYCATCHGEDGCSDGPAAVGLDPKPARHCDGNYMNTLSDEHLFEVIKEGGAAVGKSPMMAPWGGVLSDAQIRDVIAFLRSIADPPYRS